MSQLSDKFAAGKFVISAEITPPKGVGVKKMIAHAESIGPYVDAINITDCQRALVKMSSLAACKVLLDHGFEPVFQLTCRDRNQIALQSDLMGAAALGIQNLLCLTGDPVKVGDHPKSKGVFEMESVGLLHLVSKLQQREDFAGNKMNKATDFFVGAVVNPTLRSASQFTRMEKKIAAGARFFQTQASYDLDDFAGFMQKAMPLGAKLLAGILILDSFRMLDYIDKNLPGVQVPAAVLQRFADSKDATQAGIDFAVETMLKVKPFVHGFHLMSVREEHLIPAVVKAYRNRIGNEKDAAIQRPLTAES
ncbi:MAG: methylenetetrahydrofolate reductase [Bdellovibrionales bacterium]|nr:methylenetetrahydrofolate reductase [Bdellovibrionales bacterium]